MPLSPLATQAINTGMGLVLGAYNDARQLRQQKKLGNQQFELDNKMREADYERSLRMWKATSYQAQMEELTKAGLNPAMIYGMGGGGAQTSHTPTASVHAPNAPQGGREVENTQGMGIQLQLLEAQKQVLATQADKNKAEADKIRGVDTAESQQRILESKNRIEEILQNVDNKRWENELMRLDKALKEIQRYETLESQDDRLDQIEYNTKIASRNLQLITNQSKISDATINDAIKKIQADAIGAILANTLTRSQTAQTNAQTLLTNQNFKNAIQEIQLKWRALNINEQQLLIQKTLEQFHTDPINNAINQITHALDNIFIFTTPKGNK